MRQGDHKYKSETGGRLPTKDEVKPVTATTSTEDYLSMWFLNDASGYGSIFIDDCSLDARGCDR